MSQVYLYLYLRNSRCYGFRGSLLPLLHRHCRPRKSPRPPCQRPQRRPSRASLGPAPVPASSAPLRDLLDAPTALAACCGFDLCHKYILYLYLYLYLTVGGGGAAQQCPSRCSLPRARGSAVCAAGLRRGAKIKYEYKYKYKIYL